MIDKPLEMSHAIVKMNLLGGVEETFEMLLSEASFIPRTVNVSTADEDKHITVDMTLITLKGELIGRIEQK